MSCEGPFQPSAILNPRECRHSLQLLRVSSALCKPPRQSCNYPSVLWEELLALTLFGVSGEIEPLLKLVFSTLS